MTSANVLPTPDKWPHLLLPAASGSGASGASGAAGATGAGADPTDLHAAVAAGAFKGLTEAIKSMTAGEIVAALAASGLRGRGGAGFPTSEKWRACALAQADRRYVVVHAYQADPAVFTDRILLERNPYSILEGATMTSAAPTATAAIAAPARME